MSRNFDWSAIKAAYERGLTPNQIADTIPNTPTRQAIAKRAAKDGWQVAKLPEAGTAITDPRQLVLMSLRSGSNLQLAAAAAGISERTLRSWKEQDPTFEEAVRAARAAWLVSKVKQIDEAGDWKAAAYLLERSPETKDQYSQKSEGGGTTIVLKIDRTEGLTIDGKRE